jgi:hypothetical protein
MYNMMTCTGGDWVMNQIPGGCSLAWLSFAIILFLAMIMRRQCTDGILAGTRFNIIGAFVGGLGAHIILTTIFGSARWSLLGGIVGLAAGGFLFGFISDSTEGGGDYG